MSLKCLQINVGKSEKFEKCSARYYSFSNLYKRLQTLFWYFKENERKKNIRIYFTVGIIILYDAGTFWQGDIYTTTTFIRYITTKKVISIYILLFLRYDIFFFIFSPLDRMYAVNEFVTAVAGRIFHVKSARTCQTYVRVSAVESCYSHWNYNFYTIFFPSWQVNHGRAIIVIKNN